MADMIPVESSNISEIGYDEVEASLYVKFKRGTVYKYFMVPQREFVGLMESDSKGRYLKQIEKEYQYERQ